MLVFIRMQNQPKSFTFVMLVTASGYCQHITIQFQPYFCAEIYLSAAIGSQVEA